MASMPNAWPPSPGEAMHTQTFLGHPPGCAAALAAIATLEDEKLVERAATLGEAALARLVVAHGFEQDLVLLRCEAGRKKPWNVLDVRDSAVSGMNQGVEIAEPFQNILVVSDGRLWCRHLCALRNCL